MDNSGKKKKSVHFDQEQDVGVGGGPCFLCSVDMNCSRAWTFPALLLICRRTPQVRAKEVQNMQFMLDNADKLPGFAFTACHELKDESTTDPVIRSLMEQAIQKVSVGRAGQGRAGCIHLANRTPHFNLTGAGQGGGADCLYA